MRLVDNHERGDIQSHRQLLNIRGENMKTVKTAIVLILALCLFGCSHNPNNDDKSTTGSETSTGSVEAVSETVSAEMPTEKKTGGEPDSVSSSTVLATRRQQKAESSASVTAKIPSEIAQSPYVYIKSGEQYRIDDGKFAEGQKDYQGTPLAEHFSSDFYSTDRVSVNFTYGEKDWLIVLSKGLFGYRMAGGEAAVMTATKGTGDADKGKYAVPNKSDRLKAQVEGFDKDGKELFRSDYKTGWLANVYIESDIQSSDEISAKIRLTLKDEKMAELYASGLKDNGMKKVGSENALADNCYFVNGTEVVCVF